MTTIFAKRRIVSMPCGGSGNPSAAWSGHVITEEHDQSLGRSERRLLRRIFNGRTVPIVIDGRAFLAYREASRFLLSLAPDAREKAYAEMRSSAAKMSGIKP